MAPSGRPRRWLAITLTLASVLATVALVEVQRDPDRTVRTDTEAGPTVAPTVLGAVITRSNLPEAEAATPATFPRSDPRLSSTTTSAPSTTRPKPGSTTTVPDPVLIPPVTIENTTTTTEPSPTTTAGTTTSNPEP